MADNNLVEKNWDYSLQAMYYSYRPNYSHKAIDILVNYVNTEKSNDFIVADIGSGTGNLSIMLVERGLNVVAIEPNDEMRNIGIDRIKSDNIKWIKAGGLNTTLEDRSVNWVTFGSSFNVMDRSLALKESYRILKKDGFFSCLWNHRKLDDKIQKIAEDTIIEFIPDYERGVRREEQRSILEKHSLLFKDIFYLELDFEIESNIESYINAWKSVRNKYWDRSTPEGEDIFNKIMEKIRERCPDKFNISYTTRAWTAQKVG